MDDNFYKRILEDSPTGYAYHRIICNEEGIPCDYEFIDVNSAYEALTGVKSTDIIGKRITEIQPAIIKDELDWIKFYGETAIHGNKKEFEHYSEALKRWYRVVAYSFEKYYFITYYLDISEEKEQVAKFKKLEVEMQEINTLLELSLDSIPAPVFYKDTSGRYLGFNKSFEKFFGKTKGDLIGKSVFDINPLKLATIYHAKDAELFKESGQQIYETQVKDARGITHDVLFHKATMVNSVGEITGLIGIVLDITDRKQAEDALKESEERLIEAQKMAHVGSWELNLDTNNIWASKESFNIYGIEHTSNYIPLEQAQQSVLPEYRKLLDNALIGLISKKDEYDVEYKIKKVNTGEERFVHSKAMLLVDEKGNKSKVVGTIQDITKHKVEEEEIKFLSYHDQLTGLYNRRFYEEELRRLDTKRNLPMTIVMGDVNGLKLINDSLGHAMGDELLRKVAEGIIKGCRADDIIARLGGDEFVILLPKTDAAETEQIIERIQEALLNEKVGNIDFSISFGYKTKHNMAEKIEEIFKYAEDNMYRHKRSESLGVESKKIDLVMNTLYKKSYREQLHSIKVSKICEAIAMNMDFNKNDVRQIRIAGLMHDIGKIEIHEEILNKPKKLNKNEWEKMQKHSEIGYQILSSVSEFSKIANDVLEHHERWDGKGYPGGLKGEESLLNARIIAIADAFDAMTSNRTYGKAKSEEEAIREIKRCSGTQFDPEIARVFIEMVLEKEY